MLLIRKIHTLYFRDQFQRLGKLPKQNGCLRIQKIKIPLNALFHWRILKLNLMLNILAITFHLIIIQKSSNLFQLDKCLHITFTCKIIFIQLCKIILCPALAGTADTITVNTLLYYE